MAGSGQEGKLSDIQITTPEFLAYAPGVVPSLLLLGATSTVSALQGAWSHPTD